MDFLRAAAACDGGLPIVALPSTARGQSRIVAQLSGPVSTPRADFRLDPAAPLQPLAANSQAIRDFVRGERQ